MPSEHDQYALPLNQREEQHVKIKPFLYSQEKYRLNIASDYWSKMWHNLQVETLKKTLRHFLNRQPSNDNIVLHHQQAIPSQNDGEDVDNRNYL